MTMYRSSNHICLTALPHSQAQGQTPAYLKQLYKYHLAS